MLSGLQKGKKTELGFRTGTEKENRDLTFELKSLRKTLIGDKTSPGQEGRLGFDNHRGVIQAPAPLCTEENEETVSRIATRVNDTKAPSSRDVLSSRNNNKSLSKSRQKPRAYDMLVVPLKEVNSRAVQTDDLQKPGERKETIEAINALQEQLNKMAIEKIKLENALKKAQEQVATHGKVIARTIASC
jgi:hypothetical protein